MPDTAQYAVLFWIPLIDHPCHVGTPPFVWFLVRSQKWLFTLLAFMKVPASWLRSECQCIHKMWIASLKELRHVTHPASKQMLLEELAALYERASGVLSTYQAQLDPISLSLLQNITSRPLDGHIAIAKNTDNLVKAF